MIGGADILTLFSPAASIWATEISLTSQGHHRAALHLRRRLQNGFGCCRTLLTGWAYAYAGGTPVIVPG